MTLPSETPPIPCGPPGAFSMALTEELGWDSPGLDGDLVLALSGDFDEDGNVDLATAAEYTSIEVARGFGDGTFGKLRPVAASDGYPVVVGNLLGERHLDFASMSEGALRVYAGDGALGFPEGAHLGAEPWQGLATGDFDGDGAGDLVWMSRSAVFGALGTGEGFGATETISPTEGHNSRVADLDGDGDDELVVGGDSSLQVFDYDGGWTLRQELFPQVESWPLVGLADVDGDRLLDLVSGTQYGTEVILIAPGRGDGTFGDWATYPLENDEWYSSHVGEILAADFDGDCTDELVLLISDDESPIVSIGPSGIEERWIAEASGAYWGTVADFDGDGRPDLALEVGHHWIRVYQNRPGG